MHRWSWSCLSHLVRSELIGTKHTGSTVGSRDRRAPKGLAEYGLRALRTLTCRSSPPATTRSESSKRIAYGFVNVTNFLARALLLAQAMATSPCENERSSQLTARPGLFDSRLLQPRRIVGSPIRIQQQQPVGVPASSGSEPFKCLGTLIANALWLPLSKDAPPHR